jgi:hypothetical protein
VLAQLASGLDHANTGKNARFQNGNIWMRYWEGGKQCNGVEQGALKGNRIKARSRQKQDQNKSGIEAAAQARQRSQQEGHACEKGSTKAPIQCEFSSVQMKTTITCAHRSGIWHQLAPTHTNSHHGPVNASEKTDGLGDLCSLGLGRLAR